MTLDELKEKMADPEFLLEIGMATMTYNDQTVFHAATLAEAAMQIALEEMRRGRTDQAVEHLRLALDQLTAALDGKEWTIWDTIDSGKRGFDTFLDEINEAKTPTFAYWFDGLFSGKITAGTPELGAYLTRLLIESPDLDGGGPMELLVANFVPFDAGDPAEWERKGVYVVIYKDNDGDWVVYDNHNGLTYR